MALEPITSTCPAQSFKAVTPSDSTDLPDGTCRALWVGAAGNLEIIGARDTAATVLASVPAGLYPYSVRRVLNGNTTASSIVAIY